MFKKLKLSICRRLFQAMRNIEREHVARDNEKILATLKSRGRGSNLWGSARITGAEEMAIGDNVHIGDNAFIRAEGGLVIGDNTHISRNLVLYTINHNINGKRIPYDEEYVKKPVHIGANVWIGMNVCVTPGTRIGNGAIIGMGTVVTGDVPAFGIAVGGKWRLVGQRDSQHYHKCDERRAYGGINGNEFQTDDCSSA